MNGLIDDSMFSGHLVSACLREVRHSGIVVAEVYLRETLIEQDFSRIEFELEAQLFVIAGNRRASVTVPQLRVGKSAEDVRMRRAGGQAVSLSPGTHIAWFPLRYNNESSKSL